MVNKTQKFLDSYNSGGTNLIDNPNYDINWNGDNDFIEDKFIRFAYRFKFDDNQYSIISPFTGTTFIPKQFGYFVGEDEERTYKSSIVAFMENFAQEMVLKIPLPSIDPINDYKIKEVDIIYKESDGLALQVLSTIRLNTIDLSKLEGDSNFYNFTYESKKPYKTLPQDDLIRVYDKVPIKAKAQEVSGNRVMYANYQDKHNAPSSIDYYVTAQEKDYGRYDLTAQYPYHSLKEFRTYQLGVVLSDRYGRSSSVILSTKDIENKDGGRGSTFFHNYTSEVDNDPDGHPYGTALRFITDSTIPEAKTSIYPGCYADSTGKGWTLSSEYTAVINASEYTINRDMTDIISVGDVMRGKNSDYVEVQYISYNGVDSTIIAFSNPVSDIYADNGSDNTVFSYKVNKLGWYSYKLVVKQQEQDYYNVYVPGITNGDYDPLITDNRNKLAQIVLINDNVNKIPRDLSEVGPQQKKFRSSVRLYGRVTPEYDNLSAENKQWYPEKTSDNVSEISDKDDFGITSDFNDIYDEESNPLIARIATITTEVDTAQVSIGSLANASNEVKLGVYETTPVDSRLELFWETGTSGLISDLNLELVSEAGSGGGGEVAGVTEFLWTLNESDEIVGGFIDATENFKFINTAGTELNQVDIPNPPNITSVIDGNLNNITNHPFYVVEGSIPGTFKIITENTFTYLSGSSLSNRYDITMRVITNAGAEKDITVTGSVANDFPSFNLKELDLTVNLLTSDKMVISFNDKATNGSSIIAENTQGLIYEITRQQQVSPSVADVDIFLISQGDNLLALPDDPIDSNTTFEVDVKVKDASGTDNSLEDNVTMTINFGEDPLNYTIDPIGYNLRDGNGCHNGTGDSGKAVVFIFGNAIDWDTNLPSFVDTSGGVFQAVTQSSPLTRGKLRLKLAADLDNAACNGKKAEFLVFIQYRPSLTDSWANANDANGVTWDRDGKLITFNSLSNGVTQFNSLSDYDLPGEYRIIVNPSLGPNTEFVCSFESPCVNNLVNHLAYCDANYDAC